MGYAYELNICKFDLKLYKLVVYFMTISHVLIIFLKFIQNFSFAFFLTRRLNYSRFIILQRRMQSLNLRNEEMITFGLLSLRPNRSLCIFLKLQLGLYFSVSTQSLIDWIPFDSLYYLNFNIVKAKCNYFELKTFLKILSIVFLSKDVYT